MGVAVCERCSKKYVVSKIKQKWEHRCPNCNGKLLREEEVKRRILAELAKAAVERAKANVKHARQLLSKRG